MMFILLAGSSGAGKNTIIKALEKNDDRFKLLPTFTTRNKREGEVDGYPYFFVSHDEFMKMAENGELLEYEKVHTNYYGSSKKIIEEYSQEDKVLIKDIDVYGVQNIYRLLQGKISVLRVFLTTTKKELVNRLKQRGEKDIKLRLNRYKLEQKEMYKFDYIIQNNILDKTCNIIKLFENIDYKSFIPLQKAINENMIKRYIKKIKNGKRIRPVKLTYQNDNVFILKGIEKLIAERYFGGVVCKMFVDTKQEYVPNSNIANEWHNYLDKKVEL